MQEHTEVLSYGKPPLLCQQPSLHSMSFSDKERESHLPNGRSISLMDLQDSHLLHEAPLRIGRVGSQASISPLPLPHPHLHHHHPQQQQAKVVTLRENIPQSAPQVRRPLQPSLCQQRSLQPLCFQNPVYHLSNTHALCSAHLPLQASSSENLSTASTHSASPSTTPRKKLPSTTSLEDEKSPSPCWQTALIDAQSGTQVMAIARQSGAETAHIVKVEQHSRTNGGVQCSLPHSTSLRSSSSVKTDPQQQSDASSRQQSICSRDSPIPSNRTNRQVCIFIRIYIIWPEG